MDPIVPSGSDQYQRVSLTEDKGSNSLESNSLEARVDSHKKQIFSSEQPEQESLKGRVTIGEVCRKLYDFFARIWRAIPALFSNEEKGIKGIFPLQSLVRERVESPSNTLATERSPEDLEEAQVGLSSERTEQEQLANLYLGDKQAPFSQMLDGETFVRQNKEMTAEEFWNGNGKGVISRVCLAKVAAGEEVEQREAANILLQLQSTGVVGTRHPFNSKGNYDFTTTILSRILWEGQAKGRLRADAQRHLATHLLNIDGCNTDLSPAGSAGIFGESENHLLMIASSRYLKNRWMQENGSVEEKEELKYDNEKNGQEEYVCRMLEGIQEGGVFEFNARPYLAYTLTPLHNLYDYGSPKVREEAGKTLDYLYHAYALGSLWEEGAPESSVGKADQASEKGKLWVQEYPPFQRQKKKVRDKGLSDSYARAFMIPLLAKEGVTYKNNGEIKGSTTGEAAHAFLSSLSSYRLPKAVVDLVKGGELEDGQKFVQMGHGKEGCPEIYYRGKNYLLSSGGSYRSRSILNPDLQVVARPTALFTRGVKKDLGREQRDLTIDDVIHLKGRGSNYKDWNNTGVYKNFACARGEVHIPEGMEEIESEGHWKLYQPAEGVRAAVYTRDEPLFFPFSLIAPPKKTSLLIVGDESLDKEALSKLAQQQEEDLKSKCALPTGEVVEYDLDSAEDRYVITSVKGVETNRDFTSWPLIRFGGN